MPRAVKGQLWKLPHERWHALWLCQNSLLYAWARCASPGQTLEHFGRAISYIALFRPIPAYSWVTLKNSPGLLCSNAKSGLYISHYIVFGPCIPSLDSFGALFPTRPCNDRFRHKSWSFWIFGPELWVDFSSKSLYYCLGQDVSCLCELWKTLPGNFFFSDLHLI